MRQKLLFVKKLKEIYRATGISCDLLLEIVHFLEEVIHDLARHGDWNAGAISAPGIFPLNY